MATSLQKQLDALLVVQQIDTQIQRARKALASLDDGSLASEQSQSAQSAALTRREELHQTHADLKDSELKQESIEGKIKTYQQRLYQGTITNARELANIEREIEALGRQRSDMDGKILLLMEQTEQAQATLSVADEQVLAAKTQLADIVSAFHSRSQSLKTEISDAELRRSQAMDETDPALLKRYQEIRVRCGGLGVVRIEGTDCGGCHMTLPGSVTKAAKEGQQVQTCENCGRLLHLR